MDGFSFFDPNLGDVAMTSQRVAGILAAGNQWYVNETTGADTNVGSAAKPFASLGKAIAAATASNGDVVYLQGTVHVSATLNWNKDGVSLVSQRAPSNNGRGRISQTGSAVFTPLVNVTGQGCAFVGIGTFHGFADASAQVCWVEGGGRNYYKDCQFFGGGNATAAAQAGMRSLVVQGNGENLFEECTLGLDTVVRATNANATLEFLAGTPRNVFRRCTFQSLVSAAGDCHVLVGAAGLDRYALFDGCAFMNAVESTGTAMSAGIIANAAAGGGVVLNNCVSFGATAIATTGPVYGVGAVPTAATSSVAIKLT